MIWEFVKEYDHVLSAVCDIICTVVMLGGIVRNRERINENRTRIDDLETIWCPRTGKRKRKK